MNNIFKILTLVSAGLLVGGMAGKMIKSEKIRLLRTSRVTENGDQRTSRKLIEEADKQADEIQNFFI